MGNGTEYGSEQDTISDLLSQEIKDKLSETVVRLLDTGYEEKIILGKKTKLCLPSENKNLIGVTVNFRKEEDGSVIPEIIEGFPMPNVYSQDANSTSDLSPEELSIYASFPHVDSLSKLRFGNHLHRTGDTTTTLVVSGEEEFNDSDALASLIIQTEIMHTALNDLIGSVEEDGRWPGRDFGYIQELLPSANDFKIYTKDKRDIYEYFMNRLIIVESSLMYLNGSSDMFANLLDSWGRRGLGKFTSALSSLENHQDYWEDYFIQPRVMLELINRLGNIVNDLSEMKDNIEITVHTAIVQANEITNSVGQGSVEIQIALPNVSSKEALENLDSITKMNGYIVLINHRIYISSYKGQKVKYELDFKNIRGQYNPTDNSTTFNNSSDVQTEENIGDVITLILRYTHKKSNAQ